MSEEKKTEVKTEDKTSVIDENVALMRSKIVTLEKEKGEDKELIEELTKKLAQATAFIEDDQKKMILAEIKPKVDIPDEILMLKSLDELKAMKKTLDVARIPAFKSGTPLSFDKKPSARAKLDSKYNDYMQSKVLKGGNK